MRRARAHRAFAHRKCAHRVHVLLQLLLSIEPKIAFCMTMDDRTTSRLDAAMTQAPHRVHEGVALRQGALAARLPH